MDIPNYIIDIDTDFDDLNALCLCVSLQFKRKINILAIMCTDGFNDALLGTKITKFWLETQLQCFGVPVITGIKRTGATNATRKIPDNITNDFLNILANFGNFHNYESYLNLSLDTFVRDLIEKKIKFTYIITGPMTTLSHLLQTYCIDDLIEKAFFSGGNLFTSGNLINNSYIVKPEYNVYLDTNAFSIVQNILLTKLNCITLDATNNVPLNLQTIQNMKTIGNTIIHTDLLREIHINLYNKSIELFEWQTRGISFATNALFLCDEVTMLIAFGLIKKKYMESHVYHIRTDCDGEMTIYNNQTKLPKRMFPPSTFYLNAVQDIYLKQYIKNIL